MPKISIRFYNDREVRAVWDEENSKWWFSVLDIVGVLNDQDDYQKNRNYWKYLKTKLKGENSEVVSGTNQLKLLAPDGKRRLTDVLDYDGVLLLAKSFPNARAMRFVEWFTNSDETIDGKSKMDFDRAYEAKKHITDYVFSDSKGERQFAHDLDEASEVVVYAKLPRTFQIPTPVGNYAPDWAIAMKKNDVKHIFFVAETKGSMSSMDLSAIERAKIDCAEKLFSSISTANVKYHKVATYQDLIDGMNAIG